MATQPTKPPCGLPGAPSPLYVPSDIKAPNQAGKEREVGGTGVEEPQVRRPDQAVSQIERCLCLHGLLAHLGADLGHVTREAGSGVVTERPHNGMRAERSIARTESAGGGIRGQGGGSPFLVASSGSAPGHSAGSLGSWKKRKGKDKCGCSQPDGALDLIQHRHLHRCVPRLRRHGAFTLRHR